MGHIYQEFYSVGGALEDTLKYPEFKTIRDVIGYNIPELGNYFVDRETNFVLDFDLDCFTTVCEDTRYAWPENIFRRLYGFEGGGAGYFMRNLMSRAKFITICREPSYCEGIGEANKILGYLDKYFFEGCLGTSTI